MNTVWIYTFSDGTCLKLLDTGLSVEEIWKMKLIHGTCKVSHWCIKDGDNEQDKKS